MRYIPKHNLVVMNLVDLEHCGFSHDDFDFELRVVDCHLEEARWPTAILVNFGGGHIITPDTDTDTIKQMKIQEEIFREMLSKLIGDHLLGETI